ncbi:MAG: hypothetical protein H6650_01515 [Ardenticatenales bacterium]|nr:hypothetical protein [Ardenticatenales bacterium]
MQLTLSEEKTRITNAKKRVRFLGYDIKRWRGQKKVRYQMQGKQVTRRTTTYKLVLLMPRDKCEAFAKRYGMPQNWRGRGRLELQNLSELEILQIYNAEIRGFTNYYALATNLTQVGAQPAAHDHHELSAYDCQEKKATDTTSGKKLAQRKKQVCGGTRKSGWYTQGV